MDLQVITHFIERRKSIHLFNNSLSNCRNFKLKQLHAVRIISGLP